MAWQSSTINPATTSPAADITKLTNDLQVLRTVLGGGTDGDVPLTPWSVVYQSAGLIGIGRTVAGSKLDVLHNTASLVKLENNSGLGCNIAMLDQGFAGGVGMNNGNLLLYAGGATTERARVDSNGDVVIGDTITNGIRLSAAKSNPTRGILAHIFNSASSGQTGAQMLFTQNGINNWTIGQPAGVDAFVFWQGRNTIADGTEAMRIDPSRNLLVGQTASGLQNSNSLALAVSSGTLCVSHVSGTASGTAYALFGLAGTQIGSISQSGTTAVLYNTTSDERLKENIEDADQAGAVLDAVKVRQFDWKADGSHQRFGFVAQELVEVVPEAVYQPADPDDMMAVDYSKLVPLLVREVQALRARVAALEAA